MTTTFDWTNLCLSCDTPQPSERGKLSVLSYLLSPETLNFWNICSSKVGWVLKAGGSYEPIYMVFFSTGVQGTINGCGYTTFNQGPSSL